MTEAGSTPAGGSTAGADYADRLVARASAGWKQVLDVQRPYRWNLRRQNLGRVLDYGCGIGRNLVNLDGNGVGVDHNPFSVAVARERGLTAFTVEDFQGSVYAGPGLFDSLLLSHVAEHVDRDVVLEILDTTKPFIRAGGKVVFICPQERGWRTDPTHVRFVDFDDLEETCRLAGLQVERRYSFPFPRWAGRLFTYNEFVLVARIPAGG
jgi:SAM-dependent methyltransferase